MRKPQHEYTFTPEQAKAKFSRPRVQRDDEHYRHDNCRLKSKLPPIPKFVTGTGKIKSPKKGQISIKTPKKSRINYRNIDQEYSWGPGFGLPPHAKGNALGSYRRL